MFSLFEQDLKKLNALYTHQQFSFICLYGRSGTGKTAFVRDFCADKHTLFFSAQETEPGQQLASFRAAAGLYLHSASLPEEFKDWDHAFSFIAEYSMVHRLILVLDEFHIIMEHDSSFYNAFSHAVLHTLNSGRVFLIITSSSISQVQRLLGQPDAGPFSMLTAKACLTSVPFYACQPLLADFAPLEQLTLYSVTGGLPGCLHRIDKSRSVEDNIISLFFETDSLQHLNPPAFLHQELRETSTYNFLLSIIASGRSKLADIAREASVGTNKCAKYLNTLIALGVLRKEFPAADETRKRVRYVFADQMLRFWYKFVCPNLSGILFGRGRELFERQVRPHLTDFLAPVFETVCAEYLENLAESGQTPFLCREIGSWWTGGTSRKPFFRIPIVADEGDSIVLGACNCSENPADSPLLDSLLTPPAPFADRTCYCCVFSISGFKKELAQAAAHASNVWLIDLEDMIPSTKN